MQCDADPLERQELTMRKQSLDVLTYEQGGGGGGAISVLRG